ncbi:MAG: DUF72 domain-containing protein [Candidatus Nanoarchaeia archaeon]|nr:DUF72 domain-containing protein [Candidatus Haiyanarchaeum thermophilum]MCW1303228.1 DUF72 domain-containing protein [Candidatus Haiyanarchaeum thermophilum]MCW1304041.1 DUF72 domain-containing protein [Candidatus Haiyanarchaeum thermophilum]MCW1306780.1 DUF72 domain-containing protein [Candidatus Haiyanarchaeum thermophilum]MCW1307475.1 DUF72 domain-containing protein [Candidatus Haiyanarchaeum thermophilum]
MGMNSFQIFVGTSGWAYGWNPDGFDWYLQNSKLNAVELNSSFYRFPFPSQVKGWSRKGKELRWSIKVNRLISHVFKFSERAFSTWRKFQKLFEPMELLIDFYLFQLPPNMGINTLHKVEKFIRQTKLSEKFALEARNKNWFQEEILRWAENLGITFVSVDAPIYTELPREIYCTNGIVYLRMHGRTDWYMHDYSDKELKEVAKKLAKSGAKKIYVFFNNDHAMLTNAQAMLKLLRNA